MSKFKSFLKNLVSRWKTESKLIKQCDKSTPLHCKVYNLCTFVLIVLIFFRILFSFPASADNSIASSSSSLSPGSYTFDSSLSFTSLSDSFPYSVSLPFTYIEDLSSFGLGTVVMHCDQITFGSDLAGYYIEFNVVSSSPSFGEYPFPWRVYREWESDHWFDSDVNLNHSKTIFINSSTSVPTSFKSWVDTNSTFTPETSFIAGGIYHFKTFGNLPDIPDASWSDGEGYTYSYTLAGKYVTTSRTISFSGFNVTFDEYVSSSHYTVTFSVDTDDGIVNLATYSVSYGQIEFESRADLKYLVFDEALIGTYDDIEFIRQFLASGFPDTDTSATDNPWAYILEMIIEALKVDLFGYFSVWDIFTTICGIFIVTWLLKLLAGG